jgi:hypothetical protein
MAITADKQAGWQLIRWTPQSEYRENGPDLERRKHYVIERFNDYGNVTSFTDVTGETTPGDTIPFSVGEDNILAGGPSEIYECSLDSIHPEPRYANVLRRTQVWEHYTEWETVDYADFLP